MDGCTHVSIGIGKKPESKDRNSRQFAEQRRFTRLRWPSSPASLTIESRIFAGFSSEPRPGCARKRRLRPDENREIAKLLYHRQRIDTSMVAQKAGFGAHTDSGSRSSRCISETAPLSLRRENGDYLLPHFWRGMIQQARIAGCAAICCSTSKKDSA